MADKKEKKTVVEEESLADAVSDLGKEAQKVMDLVAKMTVLELSKLVKALEEKFGVSAAVPMAVAVAGNGNGKEEAEEKSEYDVILEATGSNKIAVIKALRVLNQELTLQGAKEMAESAPKPVMEAVATEKAQEIKKQLEEAGATVSLK